MEIITKAKPKPREGYRWRFIDKLAAPGQKLVKFLNVFNSGASSLCQPTPFVKQLILKSNGRYFWLNLAFISSQIQIGSCLLSAINLSTFDQYCLPCPTSFMAAKQTRRS